MSGSECVEDKELPSAVWNNCDPMCKSGNTSHQRMHTTGEDYVSIYVNMALKSRHLQCQDSVSLKLH